MTRQPGRSCTNVTSASPGPNLSLSQKHSVAPSTDAGEAVPMRQICRRFVQFLAVISVFVWLAAAQDAPSMGDVARQARQQKQSKDAQSKAAPASKTSKVITNDEIPESPKLRTGRPPPRMKFTLKLPRRQRPEERSSRPSSGSLQILAQKNIVSSLQSNIDKLNDSIQFAPGNCVAGCVQWNERQKQKQQEVDRMRSQSGNAKETFTEHAGIGPPAGLWRHDLRSVEVRVALPSQTAS